MDNTLNFRVDQHQFLKIYQDLMQIGTQNHERLTLITGQKPCFPATVKNELFSSNYLDETASKFVIEFLDNHLDYLAEQPEAQDLFLKIRPYLQNKQEPYLNRVLQKLFYTIVENSTQAVIIKKRAEAEHQLTELTYKRLQELKDWAANLETEQLKKLEDNEKQRMEEIQNRSNISEDCLKASEESIRKLQNRIDILKKESQILEDTLIVCKDGPLISHIKLLEKARFFKITKSHLDHDMKKSSLSAEEQKIYRYKFELMDFNIIVVQHFINWIESAKDLSSPSTATTLLVSPQEKSTESDLEEVKTIDIESPLNLNTIHRFEDLLELYRLSEYLNEIGLINACLFRIRNLLDVEKRLIILSDPYEMPKELVNECILYMVKNLKSVRNHPKFAHITSENSVAILNHPLLPISIHKLQNPGQFMLYNKNERKAWLSWNLPKSHLKSLGNWDEHTEESKQVFYIKGIKCYAEIGKRINNDGIIFGICVFKPSVDFDFFMEIGQLQIFSNPSDQKNLQGFNNEGKYKSFHVKGAFFPANEVEKQINTETNTLPWKVKLYIKN